jgi:hypothetical protein
MAIRDALARYCLAADSGNAKAAAALFGEACSVDIDAAVFMNGRKEVHASLESPQARAMQPRSAHITGPFVIELNGNTAVATGYMTLFMKGEAIAPARQSIGRW